MKSHDRQLEELDFEAVCVDKVLVNDSTFDRWHQRSWRLNSVKNHYCATYETNNDSSLLNSNMRLQIKDRVKHYRSSWGRVYNYLSVNSLDKVSFLADSLSQIAIKNKLSNIEQAELIVNFVQDIPYSYVIDVDCKDFKTDGLPCLGNIPLGIVTPYEFIHNLSGDCDTRAVLLFTMLAYLNYQVMILISEQYAHAVIALALKGSGDFITFKNQKYYFWETTAKGWSMGMLPPEMNNIDYWNVSLVNEL